MEIHQVECLLAVVETGSFRAASEKLHKAQSAVSLAIKKLEDEFGFELFDRAEYRPSLTARGRSLLPQFYNFQQQLSQIGNHAHFLQKGYEPKICFAVSALWPEDHLVPVLQNFTLQFPFTELVVYQEVLSADEMLLNGKADLSIGEIFDEKDRLEKRPVKSVDMISVCSSSHPLAEKRGKASKTDLLKHRQIVLKSTVENPNRLVGVEQGQPQIGVYSFSLKKQLIMCGVGWGGLPRHMIDSELKKKRLIKTHDPIIPVAMHLAWDKKKTLGPCAKFLISALSVSP